MAQDFSEILYTITVNRWSVHIIVIITIVSKGRAIRSSLSITLIRIRLLIAVFAFKSKQTRQLPNRLPKATTDRAKPSRKPDNWPPYLKREVPPMLGQGIRGEGILYLRAVQEAVQRATCKRSGPQIILGAGNVDLGSDHLHNASSYPS